MLRVSPTSCLAVVAERRDETPVSLQEMKRRLKNDGILLRGSAAKLEMLYALNRSINNNQDATPSLTISFSVRGVRGNPHSYRDQLFPLILVWSDVIILPVR
jgi:hypothetical protein